MNEIVLIFPHNLFEFHPGFENVKRAVIIEDPLFFGDKNYPLKFHKKKLIFHRASLKSYESYLMDKGIRTDYLEYSYLVNSKNALFTWLKEKRMGAIYFTNPDDYLLNKRIVTQAKRFGIKCNVYSSPMFYNSQEYLLDYFGKKGKYFLHHFYIAQRKKHKILLDQDKPVGGKWSFDEENRNKFNDKIDILQPKTFTNKFIIEAKNYVSKNFHDNPGSSEDFIFPISFEDSKQLFESFLEIKFKQFGKYQDAIVKNESFLFHSLLSSSLNSGLLTPDYVVNKSLEYAEKTGIPLNSLEGFIRQILGWREFIRGVYLKSGVAQRNSNFFNNENKLSYSLYTAKTGIDPIDDTIKKLLHTCYNHHIERLMILGNFMLLCEIHPTAVYNWFMEMYIDAYDWVMVPNVYGMSQFADGGLMSTKPYISSSNYLLKMSDYKKGEWTKIWDALFWRFVFKNHDYFLKNNRTVFMGRQINKMDKAKLKNHLETADKYLGNLI